MRVYRTSPGQLTTAPLAGRTEPCLTPTLQGLRIRLVVWGLALSLPTLAGCRVSIPLIREHLVGAVDARAEGYRTDPRWISLAEDFPERVSRALERLDVVTGLRFPADRVPEVTLRPFGDERIPYELRGRIVDGHRRVAVHVNAEPLLARTRDPDHVLLRALADAAFQDAAQRHGVVPRWLNELAGTAASGELQEVLADLRRRALAGEEDVYRIDAADAAAAPQTGAAALLLLTERGKPDEVRHLLQSVADGDAADGVMARLAHEPDGTWVRPATTAYRLRLSAVDDEPWRLLAEAESALETAGAAGLEAGLPKQVPLEVADEILILRARAAADEGDLDRAAALLDELSPHAPARVRDPAGALALRIRVESRTGGNAELARRLALELDLDFPRSRARAGLRKSHPLLGMQEDPQRWLLNMRAHIREEGTDDLDLGILERYTRTLLQDHRPGAARQFLFDLGERGTAPELAQVRLGVQEDLASPTGAAVERGAQRVARWQQDPSEANAQDVRDTGAPAESALTALLDVTPRKDRSQVIELTARTLGAARMIELVMVDWRDNLRYVQSDLEQVARYASYPALKENLNATVLAGLPRATPELAARQWESLTFGLSDRWLTAHPGFLQDVRSDAYPLRQAAFELIADEAPRETTPALVAHGLRDSAALLRRQAAKLAGEVGFAALVRQALRDDAWLVREEAVRAVAIVEGAACADVLLEVLASDPSLEVRGAAALVLLNVAAGEDRVIDALLATQVDEEVRLRDAIGARLTQLEPMTVIRGIDRGWVRALKRPDPSRSYLFRTSLLFQRMTREDLGYYPGAPRAEIRQMHRRIQAWLKAQPVSAPERNLRMLRDTPGR